MIMRTGIVSLLLPILLFLPAIPATSHAVAPDTKTHKVGLALSGGGARGAAHIGVLKVLEREGIPINCIAGTSFGAVVGGLYALGYTAAEVEQIFSRQDWNDLFNDAPERRLSPLAENRNFRYLAQLSFQGVSPELPTGLWNGQKMVEVLNSLTMTRILPAQEDFDRMPIPFRAVATNLLDGTPYVFRKGRLTEALRASVAIPMVFTPVEKDGMLLVDGGLSNNLPTDLLRDMGADIFIAVDVTSPLMQKGEIRSFLDVMDQSVSILMKQSVDRTQDFADLTVKPDLEGYSYRDYSRMVEIIAHGEQEAERRIADIRTLVAGLPLRTPPAPAPPEARPAIDSIAFGGLHRLDARQLNREVKSRSGATVDPNVVRQDLGRLYATRLFSRVDSALEPIGADRYRLLYLVKEAPPNTLGASLRFDRDDKFVALVEATARQLFGTPSSATLSTQFGGIDDDSLAFRYVSQDLPFIFLEPKVHVRRRERYDIRDGELVDRFTDRRFGGQLALGSTLFKRLEVEIAYRSDKVTIGGGTDPNRMDGSMRLAGLTLRVNRDTLDEPDFPHTGSSFRFQADKRSTALGGDVSFAKYQADAERYFSPSEASSFLMRLSAGYSRGEVPFFDRFYAGGFSYSESGPRRFVGFDRDELVANQMAILTLGYRRQLFSHPFSFTRRAFLILLYNGAGLSEKRSSPYQFGFVNGAMAGVAIDTLIGPLRIGGAWGEGGRGNFYLSFGPGF